MTANQASPTRFGAFILPIGSELLRPPFSAAGFRCLSGVAGAKSRMGDIFSLPLELGWKKIEEAGYTIHPIHVTFMIFAWIGKHCGDGPLFLLALPFALPVAFLAMAFSPITIFVVMVRMALWICGCLEYTELILFVESADKLVGRA
eukprot:scaffold7679_cov258-Pinguiococcus_pyrenoidosus.AAC.5